jgi:hypothetical protein
MKYSCFGGSCINIYLPSMIHMTSGPLEGVPYLSLQDLSW